MKPLLYIDERTWHVRFFLPVFFEWMGDLPRVFGAMKEK